MKLVYTHGSIDEIINELDLTYPLLAKAIRDSVEVLQQELEESKGELQDATDEIENLKYAIKDRDATIENLETENDRLTDKAECPCLKF